MYTAQNIATFHVLFYYPVSREDKLDISYIIGVKIRVILHTKRLNIPLFFCDLLMLQLMRSIFQNMSCLFLTTPWYFLDFAHSALFTYVRLWTPT